MSTNNHFYSRNEELVNTWSHLAGAILALAGAVVMLIFAPEYGVLRTVGSAIFAAALLGMYLASGIYHAVRAPEVKALLRRFDHSVIYLLIAGTYTPVMLLAVGGSLGITILAAVWILGTIGICLKCFSRHRFGYWSLSLYLAMGWLCVIAIRQMLDGMGPLSFSLLLAGGVVYSIGAVFYAVGRPWFHAVWHFFVLAGSMLHYFAVLTLP